MLYGYSLPAASVQLHPLRREFANKFDVLYYIFPPEGDLVDVADSIFKFETRIPRMITHLYFEPNQYKMYKKEVPVSIPRNPKNHLGWRNT